MFVLLKFIYLLSSTSCSIKGLGFAVNMAVITGPIAKAEKALPAKERMKSKSWLCVNSDHPTPKTIIPSNPKI